MQKEVFLLDDSSATEGNLEVVDKSVAGSFHRNHNNEAVKTIFSDSQFLCHFLPLGVGNIVYIVAIVIVLSATLSTTFTIPGRTDVVPAVPLT